MTVLHFCICIFLSLVMKNDNIEVYDPPEVFESKYFFLLPEKCRIVYEKMYNEFLLNVIMK